MPAASAIIISPEGFPTVRRLVSHLRAQNRARDLELVFVFPASASLGIPTDEINGFSSIRVVEVPDMDSTARARAAGVRAAAAPIVLMTEDHSLPEGGWLEALLEAHSTGCAAAGPAIANGNPESLLSWANLAIEYNEWLDPAPPGPAAHLPGHNSAYKRDVLLSYGEALGEWLEAESVLHWDLRARGHQLLLAPRAVTRHHNFSLWLDSLGLRFDAGWQYAGMCRLRWSLARRALYIAGAPLIPLVRAARIFTQFLKPGRPARLLPGLLPVCLFLLTVETAGALVGYLFGAGSSSRRIARVDFHREQHMSLADRKRWET